ncbi:MAG: 50S ribosomal protein L18 [Nanoarchaeota archaeon]|nr:50S ribosomal protein L18 [Nanoarchaeota archaeon]
MRTIKRRRKENKTDYAKRIKFLKSEKPRIVFRKTNRYFIAQYVLSEEAKDKIIFGMNSKQLLKFGWPKESSNSLKAIPAAYLFGLLFGKNILDKKLETPIIDFGMQRVLHKTKLFGFLKGLKDSKMEIECDEEKFPEEERIKGSSLKNKINFEEIKLKINK